MVFTEQYKRPCFAACSECGNHGVIIFKDGSQSGDILSLEGGKKILANLIASKKVTSEDADRIEDQFACSDLPEKDQQSLQEVFLYLFGGLVLDMDQSQDCSTPSPGDTLHQHTCPECFEVWRHGSSCAGNEKAHTCPKCGTLNWTPCCC